MTDQAAPVLRAVPFGIGCYSFEAPSANHMLMQKPGGTYSIHDWAKDVLAALKSIPSLDDIVVDGFRYVRGDSAPGWRNEIEQLIRDSPRDSFHLGGDLRPHPVDGRISFVATIPIHTQKELGRVFAPMEGTRFQVDIRYGSGMPVAFVRAPDGTLAPSHAVAIVREFLRQEFEQRLSDGIIKFTCMGPSPMWNDCFVALAPTTLADAVEVKVFDTPGYQQIAFRVREDAKTKSLDEAYDFVKKISVEELSLYYEIHSRSQIIALRHDLIEMELQALVERNRKPGVRGWWGRFFGGGSAANNLMLEILASATESQKLYSRARGQWEDIRNRAPVHAFNKAFERELEGDGQTYESNSREVVALLNERYSRDVQVASVIVSSLVGGVAGAALTGLAQVLAAATAAGGGAAP